MWSPSPTECGADWGRGRAGAAYELVHGVADVGALVLVRQGVAVGVLVEVGRQSVALEHVDAVVILRPGSGVVEERGGEDRAVAGRHRQRDTRRRVVLTKETFGLSEVGLCSQQRSESATVTAQADRCCTHCACRGISRSLCRAGRGPAPARWTRDCSTIRGHLTGSRCVGF